MVQDLGSFNLVNQVEQLAAVAVITVLLPAQIQGLETGKEVWNLFITTWAMSRLDHWPKYLL